VTCQVLEIAPSAFYKEITRRPSAREVQGHDLIGSIVEAHQDSRGTFEFPSILAELRLGLDMCIGRTRVRRAMRVAGVGCVGPGRKRKHRPGITTRDDLVKRQFTVDVLDSSLWSRYRETSYE